MACFHGFIAINNPSGMAIEWNIPMVYGGVFLFGFHPEASPLAIASMPGLALFLFVCLFAIPCFGNFFPSRVSFLLAMRYYAGNWAYNIWLVRKDALHRFARLTKAAGTMREQLEKLLPDAASVEMALIFSLAHRFMHLEGRPLFEALPHATRDIDAYEWIDGEVLGGMVLGWNFGDGHLNGAELLAAVHPQCEFEPGEQRLLRCLAEGLSAQRAVRSAMLRRPEPQALRRLQGNPRATSATSRPVAVTQAGGVGGPERRGAGRGVRLDPEPASPDRDPGSARVACAPGPPTPSRCALSPHRGLAQRAGLLPERVARIATPDRRPSNHEPRDQPRRWGQMAHGGALGESLRPAQTGSPARASPPGGGTELATARERMGVFLVAIAFGAQLALLGWIAGLGASGACVGALLGAGIGASCGAAALRRAPALAAMLVFGGLGMMLGWGADLGFRSAAELAAHARAPLDLVWCRRLAGPAALAGLPGLGHAASWMNLGMLALGMPAVAWARSRVGRAQGRGVGATLPCAIAMMLGMSAGSVAASAIAGRLTPSAVVLADWSLMSVGMLLAMVLAERVPRWLAQMPRQAASATSAQPSTVTRNPAAPA